MSSRRIRRLHVRAEAEDDARHAATLLTDAFRTASLPLADHGRLIVIRRLALGRISVHVSPASLALHIERVAHEVVSQAVTYDLASARDANAVAFHDRSDAIITLARLHARGAAADEWFWGEIVRGWRAAVSRDDRWSLLLDAAHGVPEAAIVAAAVVDQIVRAGSGDRWLSSIPAGRGAQWLWQEGWSSLEPDRATPSSRALEDRWTGVIDRWQRTWGAADDRLVWLSTMLAVHENPACVADPRLPGRIAGSLLTAFEPAREPTSDHRAPLDPTRGRVNARPSTNDDLPPENDARAHRDPERPIGRGSDDERTRASTRADRLVAAPDAARETPIGEPFDRPAEHAGVLPPAADIEPERVRREPLSGTVTPYAGLLFVVSILERLDFGSFLAAHPSLLDIDFPARLLSFIGQRVGLTPDDPLALAFQREPVDHRIAAQPFSAYEQITSTAEAAETAKKNPEKFSASSACSAVKRDGQFDVQQLPATVLDILSLPKPRTALDSPFIAWTTAVRRWCRRHARQGLTTLIRRRALVHVSRTHIDACFHLSQLDVRVRCLALDVDPGWVPWMGRVIEFTYRETLG